MPDHSKPNGNMSADLSPKISLRRVRLDRGGYDEFGAFWGLGRPLFWASSDTAGIEFDSTFRANDRADAKDAVREIFPTARFHR